MDTKKRLQIPVEVLDDLCSRFLLNIPSQEKDDMVRLCFQIELSHWFYLDFYRAENTTLPDCRVREFTKLIFEAYPFLLKPPDANVDEVLMRWREYKRSVPTFGAVILDEYLEHVLLVQGYVVKSSWGFPKGKVNKDESPEDCAAREVLEETGFDIKTYMTGTEFIEMRISEQLTRLYYVPRVPNMTHFSPKTRGEIKSVEWFRVDDLPCHKKDMTPKSNLNMAPNNFFMVIPFVKQIRRWISAQKGKKSLKSTPVKRQSLGEVRTEGQHRFKNNQGSKGSSLLQQGEILIDAEKQRQYFARENNLQLEKILQVKNGEKSPTNQKRKKNKGSQKQSINSLHHQPAIQGAGRGRGRILFTEAMPDCWKNFRFDQSSLLDTINQFAP